MLRRTLIAADRGDLWKVPFSDDIDAQSRLLMRRNILTRVQALAPFLTWDTDPYIVIGDNGHLYWILDAFTTSDSYPDSASYSFADDAINYMRNSVKVVIDAYNGTTTFYVFDPARSHHRRLAQHLSLALPRRLGHARLTCAGTFAIRSCCLRSRPRSTGCIT